MVVQVQEPKPDTQEIWSAALAAAARVARQASSSEEDLLRAVAKEHRRLGFQGAVALLQPDGLMVVRGLSLGPSVERLLRRLSGLSIEGYLFDPTQVDIYREALDSRQAVFTADRAQVVEQMMPARLRSLLPPIMEILGGHPVIIAPLVMDDRPLGAMSVTAPWLTPEDRPMVASLADHVAIGLGQVRARAEMRQALERERLRNQVIEAVASSLDLSDVLKKVLDMAIEVVDAEAGAIALVDPDGEKLTYPYLVGLPGSLRHEATPKGEGLAWRLIETGKPLLLHEYSHHPSALPSWVETGIRAYLGVPLIAGDQPIGGLGLFIKRKGRTFTDEQVGRAQAVATMAAIAVQHARLLAQANQRAEEAQALIHTARSISASLDQETVLKLIAEKAKDLLLADGSRIHLHDPQNNTLRCVIALDEPASAFQALDLKPGEGLVGHVVESGKPLISNDPTADPRGLQVPGTPEQEPEVLMMAPLRVRQRTMGVMTVRRLGAERPFRSRDLDLLIAFAAQAAVALENAHLYGQIASQAHRLEIEVNERTRDLALSEARYRALVETAVGGIFQADLEARFVYVNQAFADMVEYKVAELLGQPITVCLPKEVGQEVLQRYQARLRGELPARDVYETVFLSQFDRHIPAIVAVSLVTDEQDKPQGASILVFDISERKALEAALAAERDRLSAILANVGDAVFVMNRQGQIEFVNSAWERLNGFGFLEAVGKTPKIIKSGHHPREFYDQMWETILSGDTWSGEVVNRRKDGSTYEAVVTVQSVMDISKHVINLVGVEHDISALKEVDRLKSQFVSDVSHELRTPLTNIRLYLDLLETTDDRVKSARYLQTLTRESERLANLIDDLLSLSRLEAGATPFNPEVLDIGELLTALVEDRRSLAGSRGLELTIQTEPQLPKASVDRRLLGQVFTNLLTNAMHYTPAGGKINVRTQSRSMSDRLWVIAEIEDSGMGIAPEEQPLIFSRFYRGRAGEASGESGTGLGLAICKEIAELHSGRITVESTGFNGRGSKFTVWLPREQTPQVNSLPSS
ncbi:MAG TPA: GAF domain-containing protein [Anaerolineales bacterium]